MEVEHSGNTDYLNYEQKRSSKPVVQPAKPKPVWTPDEPETIIPDKGLLDALERDYKERNLI